MDRSTQLSLSASKWAFFFPGVLLVALMVFAIGSANAAFMVNITNCAPSGEVDHVTFDNSSGSQDIQVRKVTAVLRAFPKPGGPGEDFPTAATVLAVPLPVVTRQS